MIGKDFSSSIRVGYSPFPTEFHCHLCNASFTKRKFLRMHCDGLFHRDKVILSQASTSGHHQLPANQNSEFQFMPVQSNNRILYSETDCSGRRFDGKSTVFSRDGHLETRNDVVQEWTKMQGQISSDWQSRDAEFHDVTRLPFNETVSHPCRADSALTVASEFDCKLCQRFTPDGSSLNEHLSSLEHCKLLLLRQHELGLAKFRSLYGDAPFLRILSSSIPVPPPEFDENLTRIYRSAVVNELHCRACGTEHEDLKSWFGHALGESHSKVLFELLHKSDVYMFLSMFGDLPLPESMLPLLKESGRAKESNDLQMARERSPLNRLKTNLKPLGYLKVIDHNFVSVEAPVKKRLHSPVDRNSAECDELADDLKSSDVSTANKDNVFRNIVKVVDHNFESVPELNGPQEPNLPSYSPTCFLESLSENLWLLKVASLSSRSASLLHRSNAKHISHENELQLSSGTEESVQDQNTDRLQLESTGSKDLPVDPEVEVLEQLNRIADDFLRLSTSRTEIDEAVNVSQCTTVSTESVCKKGFGEISRISVLISDPTNRMTPLNEKFIMSEPAEEDLTSAVTVAAPSQVDLGGSDDATSARIPVLASSFRTAPAPRSVGRCTFKHLRSFAPQPNFSHQEVVNNNCDAIGVTVSCDENDRSENQINQSFAKVTETAFDLESCCRSFCGLTFSTTSSGYFQPVSQTPTVDFLPLVGTALHRDCVVSAMSALSEPCVAIPVVDSSKEILPSGVTNNVQPPFPSDDVIAFGVNEINDADVNCSSASTASLLPHNDILVTSQNLIDREGSLLGISIYSLVTDASAINCLSNSSHSLDMANTNHEPVHIATCACTSMDIPALTLMHSACYSQGACGRTEDVFGTATVSVCTSLCSSILPSAPTFPSSACDLTMPTVVVLESAHPPSPYDPFARCIDVNCCGNPASSASAIVADVSLLTSAANGVSSNLFQHTTTRTAESEDHVISQHNVICSSNFSLHVNVPTSNGQSVESSYGASNSLHLSSNSLHLSSNSLHLSSSSFHPAGSSSKLPGSACTITSFSSAGEETLKSLTYLGYSVATMPSESPAVFDALSNASSATETQPAASASEGLFIKLEPTSDADASTIDEVTPALECLPSVTSYVSESISFSKSSITTNVLSLSAAVGEAKTDTSKCSNPLSSTANKDNFADGTSLNCSEKAVAVQNSVSHHAAVVSVTMPTQSLESKHSAATTDINIAASSPSLGIKTILKCEKNESEKNSISLSSADTVVAGKHAATSMSVTDAQLRCIPAEREPSVTKYVVEGTSRSTALSTAAKIKTSASSLIDRASDGTLTASERDVRADVLKSVSQTTSCLASAVVQSTRAEPSRAGTVRLVIRKVLRCTPSTAVFKDAKTKSSTSQHVTGVKNTVQNTHVKIERRFSVLKDNAAVLNTTKAIPSMAGTKTNSTASATSSKTGLASVSKTGINSVPVSTIKCVSASTKTIASKPVIAQSRMPTISSKTFTTSQPTPLMTVAAKDTRTIVRMTSAKAGSTAPLMLAKTSLSNANPCVGTATGKNKSPRLMSTSAAVTKAAVVSASRSTTNAADALKSSAAVAGRTSVASVVDRRSVTVATSEISTVGAQSRRLIKSSKMLATSNLAPLVVAKVTEATARVISRTTCSLSCSRSTSVSTPSVRASRAVTLAPAFSCAASHHNGTAADSNVAATPLIRIEVVIKTEPDDSNNDVAVSFGDDSTTTASSSSGSLTKVSAVSAAEPTDLKNPGNPAVPSESPPDVSQSSAKPRPSLLKTPDRNPSCSFAPTAPQAYSWQSDFGPINQQELGTEMTYRQSRWGPGPEASGNRFAPPLFGPGVHNSDWRRGSGPDPELMQNNYCSNPFYNQNCRPPPPKIRRLMPPGNDNNCNTDNFNYQFQRDRHILDGRLRQFTDRLKDVAIVLQRTGRRAFAYENIIFAKSLPWLEQRKLELLFEFTGIQDSRLLLSASQLLAPLDISLLQRFTDLQQRCSESSADVRDMMMRLLSALVEGRRRNLF